MNSCFVKRSYAGQKRNRSIGHAMGIKSAFRAVREVAKRATSMSAQLLRLQRDPHTGSILRDSVNFPSELYRRRPLRKWHVWQFLELGTKQRHRLVRATSSLVRRADCRSISGVSSGPRLDLAEHREFPSRTPRQAQEGCAVMEVARLAAADCELRSSSCYGSVGSIRLRSLGQGGRSKEPV